LLAACALLTVSLTSDVGVSQRILYILAGYGIFAIALAGLTWVTRLPLVRLRLVTHAVDVVVFVVMYAAESHLAGSFFVFFIFSLLSATLRWEWRGTLSTAAITLFMALAMGVYQSAESGSFIVNQFMIRAIYLVVLSVLVSYLVIYELHLRRNLSKLATRPSSIPEHFQTLLHELLRQAAHVVSAPRLLLAWEDASAGWLMLAEWTSRDFVVLREVADACRPLVDDRLRDLDFYCEVAGVAPVVVRTGDRFRRWSVSPVHRGLQRRFGMHSILSVKVTSAEFVARVFWLDKRKIIADDLMLASLFAREASSQLDQFQLIEQRKRAASTEERIQLARDLHDGLLQSLTAIGLKLEELRDVLAEDSHGGEKHVVALQRLLVAEQRYLRYFIGHLKPTGESRPLSLEARLRLLIERVELEWSVAVELGWLDGAEPELPVALADEVYYIVSEAVVNAARHSSASIIRVEIGMRRDEVLIRVADNGTGFSFRGRYEDRALDMEGLGPGNLRERVDALSGRLAIDSSEHGSRLDISLPSPQLGVGRGD
jgi:signal transduction histidine kinase